MDVFGGCLHRCPCVIEIHFQCRKVGSKISTCDCYYCAFRAVGGADAADNRCRFGVGAGVVSDFLQLLKASMHNACHSRMFFFIDNWF